MDPSKEKSPNVIDDFQSTFPVQRKRFTNRSGFSLSPLLLAACGGGASQTWHDLAETGGIGKGRLCLFTTRVLTFEAPGRRPKVALLCAE